MELTSSQESQLRASLAFRKIPPTVRWYFQRSWRTYAYLAVLCGAAIMLSVLNGWPLLSGFSVGVLLTALVRDFKFFERFVQAWPLSNEITNWHRVEELLAQAESRRPNISLERTREG